jgi:hypothetical protein
VGAADSWNLNEISLSKAIKCCHLNLMFVVLSMTLHTGYTLG